LKLIFIINEVDDMVLPRFKQFVFWGLLVFLLAACGSTPQAISGQLKVVATTTIVGDVVHTVAGQSIELTVLLPPGADPHNYEPSPQDLAKIADADLIVLNGAGLEEVLEPLIENAGGSGRVIHLSEGITLLEGSIGHDEETPENTQTHTQGDPHVWTDPNNILSWVDHLEATLSELNSTQAELYEASADQYRAELKELDEWIHVQVDQIPLENRQLVTDHVEFTYFAERYGFTLAGAVIPNYSTTADTSAQELAALEDTIRSLGVQAIFVGNTTNPDLAQRVANDTGVQLVPLLTGSLTELGGGAETYLEYIRYNVNAIVQALK